MPNACPRRVALSELDDTAPVVTIVPHARCRPSHPANIDFRTRLPTRFPLSGD